MNGNRDAADSRKRELDPFEAAWEAEARRTLQPTGFDVDLGVRAARDALRVTAGELSEAEFHKRYHSEYLQAFEMDARPLLSDEVDGADSIGPTEGGGPAGSEEQPALMSRRTAMKLAGAGAAALFLGQLLSGLVPSATADEGGHQEGGHAASGSGATKAKAKNQEMQMGMVIDIEKCDGCLFCVNACKSAYTLADGVHWIYVFAYAEPDAPEEVNLLPRLCNHCSNAPCVKVCPVAARHKREDGLVLTDYDTCIGCRYCQVACPYGVNYFQWGEPTRYGGGYTGERRDARGRSVVGDPPRGVMGKCTFCPLRQDSQDEHGTTNCALACPHGVLHYGDLNDPESEPNQYLARRRQENGGRLETFRLLEDMGTKPNVIYIGSPPSREAYEVEGPVRYEDWGLVKQRRAVLEGPEPWFRRLIGGN